MIPNVDLELKIEEKDDLSERVVQVINHDPNTRIECVQISHMAIKDATSGCIIIHLSPLTDNAVHRFLRKDGTVVQDMVEKLFTSVGLHSLLKKREEIEIIVKISEKKSTAEEKGRALYFYRFLSHLLFNLSHFKLINDQSRLVEVFCFIKICSSLTI